MMILRRLSVTIAVSWYDFKQSTGNAARLYYEQEHITMLKECMPDGYNAETMKYFVPMTMSADGAYIISYIYPDNDENPVIVLAKLKE